MPKLDYSKHVLEMFWRFVLLPVTACQWICRLMSGWCSTADSRRAKDSLRQSRVRRGLRGLTPDHDPADNRRGVRHASVPTSETDPIH